MNTVYDFPITLLNGQALNWDHYCGKVLLLVNTASKCGFTPRLAGLEALQQQYGAQGFAVIGFPCNQFGGQEPGSGDEIALFCQQSYGVDFALSEKIEVNGEQAHPLWRYLQQQKSGLAGLEAIKWNFTKFLINRQGHVAARFAPLTKPEKLQSDIERLLAA